MAVKRWVWVVFGVFTFLFVLCIGLAGTGFYFLSRHIETKDVTPAQAAAEFAQVRARFKGEPALIDIRSNGISTERLRQRIERYSGPRPTVVHLLAWEEGEKGRVRVTLPMWLLRFKGSFDVRSSDVDLERIRLDVEDIERAGPALLVDQKDGRTRLLMWTE